MAAGVYPADVAIPSLPPVRFLLRRIDGRDEAALAPGRPAMATHLLASLLTTREGGAVDVTALPVAVHDRLLACLYREELGPRLTCRTGCNACAHPLEFSFVLADLIAAQDEAAARIGPPEADGRWPGPGARLRPPTLADGEGGPEALLARIADRKVAPKAVARLAAFLEDASPLLSLDIDTACLDCGARQAVWFDLARFLVQALAAERPFLIRETHLIAARYGWGHDEIMALPRADRRAYAALIESERSAALRRAS
jgi:hypothetical protein